MESPTSKNCRIEFSITVNSKPVALMAEPYAANVFCSILAAESSTPKRPLIVLGQFLGTSFQKSWLCLVRGRQRLSMIGRLEAGLSSHLSSKS